MGLALVQSRALLGFAGNSAVHGGGPSTNGLPSFTLVGLADVEVRPARRVRAAIVNAGQVPRKQQAHHGQSYSGGSAQGPQAA